MNSLPDIKKLNKALHAAVAKMHMLNTLAFLFQLLGIASILFFVVFVCDYLTRFPMTVRLAVTVVVLLFLLLYFPWKNKKLWQKIKDIRKFGKMLEAAAAKQQKGGFGSIIISALEFSGNSEIGGSEVLKSRVIEKSQEGTFHPMQISMNDKKAFKKGALLLAAGGVIMLLWGGISSNSMLVFCKRAFGMDVSYSTRTKIEDVKYPEVSAKLEPVEIKVKVTGVKPASGRLRIKFASEAAFDLRLDPVDTEGNFAAVVENPAKNFTFDILIGDDIWDKGKVEVRRPPYVVDGTVTVKPPTYTGLEDRTYPVVNVDIPESSQFNIRIKPDRNVKECVLDMVEKQYPFKEVADGWFELNNFKLKTTKRYSIKLVDDYGIENRERVFYTFSITKDLKPVITLDKPGKDSYWAPVSQVDWAVTVSDDYGLKSLKVHCDIALPGSQDKDNILRQQDLLVKDLGGKREVSLADKIKLMELDLSPGQIVLFSIHVLDTSEKQWVKSDVARMQIVSTDDLRRIIEEEEQVVSGIIDDLQLDVKRQVKILEMRERLK